LPALNDAERALLSGAARALRKASRCLVIACEARGVRPLPDVATWPLHPRRGGWARAVESDQAEDERLHRVVVQGAALVRALQSEWADDSLVRLACTAFASAGERYKRASLSLHTARRPANAVSWGEACDALRRTATDLVQSVERACASDDEPIRLHPVPGGLEGATQVLQRNLRRLEADPEGAGHLLLAAHLDGALGLMSVQSASVSREVLTAGETAAVGLASWDEATGSFRGPRTGRLLRGAGGEPIPDAYRALPGDVLRVEYASDDLLGRLDELGDRVKGWPMENDVAHAVRERVRLAQAFRDSRGDAAVLPAFDGACSAFALNTMHALGELAGECFDSGELTHHDLGRSIERAHRAAESYLAASGALAYGVRGGPLSQFDVGDALERLVGVVQPHGHLLPLISGEVAATELAALTVDAELARRMWRDRPELSKWAREAVLCIARRACDSAWHVVVGEAGGEMAHHPNGGPVIEQLRRACSMLENALGISHAAAPRDTAESGSWLAAPDHSAAIAVQRARSRTFVRERSRTVDRNPQRPRGPAVGW